MINTAIKKCEKCQQEKDLFYSVIGDLCDTCFDKEVEKLCNEFGGVVSNTDVPVCPHCGYKKIYWHEYFDGSNSTAQVECGRCLKKYEIEIELNPSFWTSKI